MQRRSKKGKPWELFVAPMARTARGNTATSAKNWKKRLSPPAQISLDSSQRFHQLEELVNPMIHQQNTVMWINATLQLAKQVKENQLHCRAVHTDMTTCDHNLLRLSTFNCSQQPMTWRTLIELIESWLWEVSTPQWVPAMKSLVSLCCRRSMSCGPSFIENSLKTVVIGPVWANCWQQWQGQEFKK